MGEDGQQQEGGLCARPSQDRKAGRGQGEGFAMAREKQWEQRTMGPLDALRTLTGRRREAEHRASTTINTTTSVDSRKCYAAQPFIHTGARTHMHTHTSTHTSKKAKAQAQAYIHPHNNQHAQDLAVALNDTQVVVRDTTRGTREWYVRKAQPDKDMGWMQAGGHSMRTHNSHTLTKHTLTKHTLTHSHTLTLTLTLTHMHALTHTRAHTHTHSHTHTHTHSHTHTHTYGQGSLTRRAPVPPAPAREWAGSGAPTSEQWSGLQSQPTINAVGARQDDVVVVGTHLVRL